ncbi:MAG: ABC transporter ATP-binding protein [Nitrospiraceae bacterium]
MTNQFSANMSPTRKIWSLLTPAERRGAVVLLGWMLVGMVLETMGVGLVIPVVGLLSQPDFASGYPVLQRILAALGNSGHGTVIAAAMLGLVGVYFFKSLFLAFLAWWQMRFAFGVQERLSQRLFMVYLCQPYTFHLQRNSAQLIRNVISEVTIFTGKGTLSIITLLAESMVLFGLCSLLLVVEPVGTLATVGVLGAAAWGFHRFTRTCITRWGEARQHHEGLRIQHLQEGLGGAKDVKLLGRETEFLDRYRLHNVQSARVGRLQATLQQLPRLWLELLAIGGLATLVLSMLAQGRALESVLPTLGLFAAAAFRLMPSVNRVLGAVQSLRYGLPVIHTLYEELKLATPEPTVRSSEDAHDFQTEIRLTDIRYAYPGASALALNGLSVGIRKGESVGFIGPSGSGKSTLVDIILGLLTPDAGRVTVDGQDIQADLRAWQNQIGYVPQSIYLTDDTLRRNVAFGLPDEQIDDMAVRRAIQAAQLDEFVRSLPNGLETFVGERGVRLSGGQRQRIGIARALYHDPGVLVLDEATSALDIATERGVMQAVTALRGSKTILIVAHRSSTVEHCDRLSRLEQGRIVEEGSPRQLFQAKNVAPQPAGKESIAREAK